MPSPSTPRRIRIFVSSPSDVAEERRLARELIEGMLRRDPAYRDRLWIECVAWDDPEAPTPIIATKVPQDSVEFIPIRPLAARESGAPGSYEGRS
jgi:hypothetical protein